MDPLAPDPRTSDQESPAVWGLVATLLWTVLIAVAFLVVQIIVAGIYAIVTMREVPRAKVEAALAGLQFDGLFLAVCTVVTLLVCAPLIVGIVKLKRGSQLKDYLGLKVPRLRQLLVWSIITIAFGALVDLILTLLHEHKTSEFMLKVYGSANPRWPLWLAIVIVAPVFEEIAFRGFIFKGLAASRLHWTGATLITSLLWAAIHLQYDWYEVSVIFALGLVLGTARALANSTLLTIWLHCLVNILASVQIEIVLRHGPINN
jgi:membrane protease YdiL (CAAX protease family)